jgi:hypothetical protein
MGEKLQDTSTGKDFLNTIVIVQEIKMTIDVRYHNKLKSSVQQRKQSTE